MLTPHDGRLHFGLSEIRNFDHMHASPKLYHYTTGADHERIPAVQSNDI